MHVYNLHYKQKVVVSISIFVQSTNEQCNYLQGVLGIFYHSTSIPKKVIETLAHTGLSISLTSIHTAVKSLLQDAACKIKAAVHTLTMALAYVLKIEMCQGADTATFTSFASR